MIYVIHWFVNILTLGLVSIATITTTTYHVDDPITELNNQSLNDVFLDGNLVLNYDFSNGVTNWGSFLGIYSVSNNILSQTGDGTNYYPYITQSNVMPSSTDSYYIYVKARVTNNDATALKIESGLSDLNVHSPNANQWYDFQYIRTPNNYTTLVIQHIYPSTTGIANGSVMQIDGNVGVFVINMTALGINNLNEQEMNQWFDIYQQAKANNGVYIESSSHLNNNIHLVDVSVMVISFAFWVWLFKFLKGVIF